MPNDHNTLTNEESTYLAFDFGMKRIGVAVGQSLTGTATPLPTLEVKKQGIDWGTLDQLVSTWKPDAFIVGIPYNMDGTKGPITQPAQHFAQTLASRFKKPVYQADERLTTIEAKQTLFERKGYRGLKTNTIDSVAAQLIFEGWWRK